MNVDYLRKTEEQLSLFRKDNMKITGRTHHEGLLFRLYKEDKLIDSVYVGYSDPIDKIVNEMVDRHAS